MIIIIVIVAATIWGVGTAIRFAWAYSEYTMHRDLLNENSPGTLGPTQTYRRWETEKLHAAKTMRTPHRWPIDTYLSIKKTILESRKDADIDR